MGGWNLSESPQHDRGEYELKVKCESCRWMIRDSGSGGYYCEYSEVVIPLYFKMKACKNYKDKRKHGKKLLQKKSDK